MAVIASNSYNVRSAHELGNLAMCWQLVEVPCGISAPIRPGDRDVERVGLHPGLLWALLTIAVEVTGPMLIISGRYVWLGTGMLGIFTCLANLLVNRFWEMAGDGRFVAINSFFEHIALIAGFILAALVAEQEYRQRQAARPRAVD
jgi:uncharacterized membrane protein YphA (DoxX/SURF4 family)